MRFSYYNDLSAHQQLVYRKSDAVERLALRPDRAKQDAARDIERAIEEENLRKLQQKANGLCWLVCSELKIKPVVVKVRAKRPSKRGGELHGLFEWEKGKTPVITIWARTAKKRQMVSFKTFLRTLIHELCHHIDFLGFRFRESFHTQGFFKRESSLYKSIVPELAAKGRGRSQGKEKPVEKQKSKPESRQKPKVKPGKKPEAGPKPKAKPKSKPDPVQVVKKEPQPAREGKQLTLF